jgi:hypothetical protein
LNVRSVMAVVKGSGIEYSLQSSNEKSKRETILRSTKPYKTEYDTTRRMRYKRDAPMSCLKPQHHLLCCVLCLCCVRVVVVVVWS